MISKTLMNKISSILFVFIALILISAPYQGDSTLGSDSLRSFLRIILFSFSSINTLITFINVYKNKKIEMINVIFILPMIIYFIMSRINTYEGFSISTSTIYLILWISFCLSPKEVKVDSFYLLRKVWVVLSILGIICYISYSFKLFIPYNTVGYYSLNKYVSYIDYKIIYMTSTTSTLRLCGICNEPGYFGTLSALLLCANNLNLKDKENIILFVAGCLTFSFAFFLMLLIELIFKCWKNWKEFIIVLILIICYLFVLPNISTNNANVNRLLSRFEITEKGLNGDNRSNDIVDNTFESVLANHPFFGMGNGYVSSKSTGGIATYKSFIIEYGIIGALLVWGILFIIALYGNTRNFQLITYVLIFFISIYQRPNIMNLQYEILLFGGITYIKYYTEKNKNKVEKTKNNQNIITLIETS